MLVSKLKAVIETCDHFWEFTSAGNVARVSES